MESKNKLFKSEENMKLKNLTKGLSVILMLLAMLFSCQPTDIGSNNSNQQNQNNQNDDNTGNDDVVTTGKIVGKATYTNATSHDGIQVTLVSSDGIIAYNSQISNRSRSVIAVMKNVVTSKSGEYSFDNVKEGVYTIYASSNDSTEKAVLTNVVVQANQIVTAADLNLTATGSISGRVTLDGNENENLGITVVIAGTSYMAVTDSFGFFIISDIPADKGYQVVIMKGDYCTIWSKVSVEAGKENNLGDKNISSLKVPTDTPSNTANFIWQGAFSTSPTNPEKYWAYFNTTDGCSYIYDGEKWTLLAQAGKDGENGTNGGSSVEHKIIYELNGGTNNSKNPNSFLEYLGVYLNRPTREGYYFGGWYETSDFSGDRITRWDVGERRTDVTLYAKWLTKAEAIKLGIGVYSYTLNIEDISGAWGGTTVSPAFSVVLLTDEGLAKCVAEKNFKVNPATAPEYQLGAFGSMKIKDTAEKGTFRVYGANPVDDVYQYYNGVAATVTDTTFTLFVDMEELAITDLKALWEGDSEKVMTNDDIVDFTGYKPYVVALGLEANDETNFKLNAWCADVMAMTDGVTFPAGAVENAPIAPSANAINCIVGSVTSWDHTPMTDNKYTFTAEGGDVFSFTMGNWAYRFADAVVDALDKEVALTEYYGGDPAFVTFADGVLTAGTEYVVTFIPVEGHKANVKVSKK